MREALAQSEALGIPQNWNRPTGLPHATTSLPEHVAALTLLLSLDLTANVNGCEFYISGSEVGTFPDVHLERNLFAPKGWDLASLSQPSMLGYLFGERMNRFSGAKQAV